MPEVVPNTHRAYVPRYGNGLEFQNDRNTMPANAQHRSKELLERMEAMLHPVPYRDGFRTVEKGGIFYTDRPGWEGHGVIATATSEYGVRANIKAMTDRCVNPRQTLIVWC